MTDGLRKEEEGTKCTDAALDCHWEEEQLSGRVKGRGIEDCCRQALNATIRNCGLELPYSYRHAYDIDEDLGNDDSQSRRRRRSANLVP